MSNYWLLACQNCGETADMMSIKNGDETIEMMVQAVDAILAVPGQENLDLDLKVNFHDTPIEFVKRHRAHVLVAQDSYGRTKPIEREAGTVAGFA